MLFRSVQFLLLAQMLLWLSAGPVLALLVSRRPTLGLPILALAVVSPLGYLGRKAAPSAWTSGGARDADRVRVSPAALDACGFLARHSATTDRVLVPIDRAGGTAAARGLFLAALCGRRVPAIVAPVHVNAEVSRRRIEAVRSVYTTEDAAVAEAILDELGVSWVWEDESNPLRFRSPRLEAAFTAGSTRLHRVAAPRRE